jgi:hypothetical protein
MAASLNDPHPPPFAFWRILLASSIVEYTDRPPVRCRYLLPKDNAMVAIAQHAYRSIKASSLSSVKTTNSSHPHANTLFLD